MDAQQQLAWDAEFSAAVLGNAAGEVLIVDLDGALPSDIGPYKQRGFTWCGVIGFQHGRCTANLEPTVEARACVAPASFQFAQLIAAKFKQSSEGAEWLKRLYSLPDTRTEN
jgi:hypothetical protein